MKDGTTIEPGSDEESAEVLRQIREELSAMPAELNMSINAHAAVYRDYIATAADPTAAKMAIALVGAELASSQEAFDSLGPLVRR